MAVGAMAALVALVLVAAVVRLPYVVISPGSARTVGGLVTVEGAPSYPSDSVSFTTVSTSEATLLELVRGWIDDEIEVAPTEVLRGDRSRDEARRYNAQLMDTSKLFAIAVAMRQLGHEVTLVTSGTVVRTILEGSPAEGVLELDDVIVAVDGEPLDAFEEVRDLLQVGGPGATHRLTVERPAGSTNRVEVDVTTEAAEDDPARAIVGIGPEERIVDALLPFEVGIDSGDVGGPSAGLAFTLAVLDVLTPGELTGGHRVAVTGTMALDGSVGPVGGGLQKAVAVRNAGYDAFLVPSAEVEEVEAVVGDDLRVIAVDTLAEALEALESLGGDVAALGAAGTAAAP
jgi:PDZ domain-containing protein